MNNKTIIGDTERLETRIMLKPIVGMRSIESIWVVRYDMDYGIAQVFERVTFDRRVGRASREVRAAIDMLTTKYPTATVAIY